MDQKIDVLIVEPGKEPRLTTVADDLEHLQQIVGGPIEAGCYLPQRVILSLMELIVGGKAGLEPIEKTVIDRCVHMVYRDYLQDPRPEKMPVLGDLHQLLCQQPEPEAQRLATDRKSVV